MIDVNVRLEVAVVHAGGCVGEVAVVHDGVCVAKRLVRVFEMVGGGCVVAAETRLECATDVGEFVDRQVNESVTSRESHFT